MSNLNIAPENYIAGFDNIGDIGKSVKKIVKKIVVVVDEKTEKIVHKAYKSFEKEEISFVVEYFNGECCFEEIKRIEETAVKFGAEGVVGFGGGKLLDTVKAAGYNAGVKIINVPTVAATCAAWSSHSAVYTDEGIAYEYYSIHRNPDMVFVDKKILMESPIRFTIAGIADTLAKWIETNAFTRETKIRNTETEIAICLAKKSYNEILEYGEKAVSDIQKGIFSREADMMFTHIVFTAGLIGGIGGAACRAVAAHAVNNGFTVLKNKYKNSLHGEAVAFGNIVQMILDNDDEDKIRHLVEFYKKINIPYNFETLGYGKLNDSDLEKVINKALYKGDTIWNLPYKVNYDMLYNAIRKADLGLFSR